MGRYVVVYDPGNGGDQGGGCGCLILILFAVLAFAGCLSNLGH